MSAVSLFDWTIYRQLFSAEAMENIFGEVATLQRMVEFERAVAKVQGDLEIIPDKAARQIVDRISADKLDLQRLREDTLEVGRPVVGLVKQLAEQVDDDCAQWLHYGLTTYDVMDTAKVLQLRDGLDEILTGTRRYREGLKDLAAEHRDTTMIARTNNLHAQPTTFGAKLATWLEEMLRHEARFEAARERVLVVQLGGAVGTLASLHPEGLDFRAALAQELGLGTIQSNWHNARDSMAEVMLCLSNLCASLARNAQNLNHLAGSDIAEVSKAGAEGRGRSSSMAHKRNPRAAEFAEATARLGRQRAAGILEVMGQDHDRCGGTWIAEWMLVPETFLLTSGALAWAVELLQRLEVHSNKMMDNINASKGLVLTERYTLALATKISKGEARRLIDEACVRVIETNTPLPEVLKGMADVRAVLGEDEIMVLADPRTYVGAAGDIVDDVLATTNKME
ncbi:MAG: 3-carboxy-cis,cis-muconate cycloisomerase [Alphaproteobacteria bacterium]|nr:3-carboxy-cis,cis-muconate cycloisomerase [Alphaproteobacteria bacterium]